MKKFNVFAMYVAGILCTQLLFGQDFTKVIDQVVHTDGGDSRSVNWVDYDNDDDLDLFVSNGHSPATRSFLYRNDGGTFTKVTGTPPASNFGRSDGASWGDYDNDGDPDLYVVNWYNDRNLFYENLGDGECLQITEGPLATARGFSEACSWVDYNNDGHLDMYVANSGNAFPEANYLFLNNGDKTFTQITEGDIVTDRHRSRSPNWADYDGDGDLDLYVSNESDQQNKLYKNLLTETGSADFETVSSGLHVVDNHSSISASWGDYDNDGDLDLFVANLNQNNNLYQNNGDGSFSKISEGIVVTDGGYSFGCNWADFDNDGDLDLFVANGWGNSAQQNFLYRNELAETGSATFTKITDSNLVRDGGWSYGSSWADYDKDGDLDLVVAKWFNGNNENNSLFRNNNPADNSWIILNLSGMTTNKSAIGAIARVKTTINSEAHWQTRQVSGQDSYCGQNLQLHFGLGIATVIDSIIVEWPSGTVQKLDNMTPNMYLDIIEGVATGINSGPQGLPQDYQLLPNFPNPLNPSTTIQYRLPNSASVTVKIYDALGKEIQTLVNEYQPAGLQTTVWNGTNFRGEPSPSGVYLYQLTANDFVESRRMTLLR